MKFKVTAQHMFGSTPAKTKEYEAENHEEMIKLLKKWGFSTTSAVIDEIVEVEASKEEEIKQPQSEAQKARAKNQKILSTPTRDELLYEMDANGVDEITFVETTGLLKKSYKTYKRSDLGEYSKEFILSDGSINQRELQLHLTKYCKNFSSREELEEILKTETEKLLKSKASDGNRIIEMLVDLSYQ